MLFSPTYSSCLPPQTEHQTAKLLRPTRRQLTFFVDFFSLTSYLSLERSHSHDPGLMNCNHRRGSHQRSDHMSPFKPLTLFAEPHLQKFPHHISHRSATYMKDPLHILYPLLRPYRQLHALDRQKIVLLFLAR